jgi:hypothetical protein
MPQWKPIVGLSFDAQSFDVYCKALHWTAWRPSFIALHNTGVPNLAQRPQGFTKTHIDNLVGYYRDKQKWSAGPHLFVDDRQIWVFTPLTTTGRHSPGWNQIAIGLEMLGDYAKDDFDSGRGAAVRRTRSVPWPASAALWVSIRRPSGCTRKTRSRPTIARARRSRKRRSSRR